MKIKQALSDVLDQLLLDVLRIELDAELEFERSLFREVLSENLLVQFEPSNVAFVVLVLETKPPDLTETNSLHNLVRRREGGREGRKRIYVMHFVYSK